MSEIMWTELKDAPVKELYEGVRRRLMWTGENGRRALVVEIDAGAYFKELDVHEPGAEEVYVVCGVFNDGVRDYPAGTFIHNPAGSSHIPQSKTGCTLFVFYPEG
ncbi:MAG TPA: cupin domain-containing protein [Pyrinomonadaceae bacterium]|nr:cupin domain-containing protein [Pyrinomonadaceae bacterium]